jgi:hypothetical protein
LEDRHEKQLSQPLPRVRDNTRRIFPQDAELLKLVGFLGVAEAREGVGRAFTVHFYFYGAFGFCAGFAEDGEGG